MASDRVERADQEVRFPTRQLAHRVGFQPGGEPGRGEYALFPIRVPRPAADRVTVRIACGECSAPIDCTVFSAADTARRRKLFLVYCVVSVAVALAYCVYAALYFSQPAGGSAQGWKVLLIPFVGILLLPASGIMAWGLLSLYREEDGVRIKPVKGHSLRAPGAVVDGE